MAMKSSCSVMEMATFFGGVYQLVAYASMALNTLAIFRSLLSSMLGPGLALRGQDGAMDQAVEGLALEYRTGARSLRGIFEELVTPILYVVPDQPEIRTVTITSLFAGPTVTRGT
jgi:ATP-dependent Clp protease ATP-binding subunit ClpX